MSDIVLTTLNARYHHASFGLRYLLANLGDLRDRAALREFTINQSTTEILERIVAEEPQIVGIGVYIWNAEQSLRLVADLKRVRPETVVVLGGPEVSYETERQEICRLADYVIAGEADIAFRELCENVLASGGCKPTGNVDCAIEDTPRLTPWGSPKELATIIHAPTPQFSDLALPYDLYNEDDIANRVIYVEASRGCPFTCEFCLSALEIPVRQASLDEFLEAMQSLLDRGVRRFKFVDRTFNLNIRIGRAILEFFLERIDIEDGMFLHFEMIPDRFPEPLKELVRAFPPGALQFEVGIQTFNEEVSERISRRQDNAQVESNLRFLRDETGVHVHADLIVGLPGESIESFAAGFDRLVSLGPQEIQVGMLKRLRGTPIVRHDDEWQMVYSPNPPYEVLQTKLIDFKSMTGMRRFARYWDLIANSGNFTRTLPLLWHAVPPLAKGGLGGVADGCGYASAVIRSPFAVFKDLCDYIYTREQRTHGIPLSRLAKHVFEQLTDVRQLDREQVARSIWADYTAGGRHDKPRFLRPFDLPSPRRGSTMPTAPRRQARHAVDS